MSSYRPSLGTRGELRRIAAEAETATIERVRPWKRKLQPCKLAPHVLVPQWVRGEPVAPQPRAGSIADEVVRIILKSLMDEVCRGPSPKRVTTRASDEALNGGEEEVDDDAEIRGGEAVVGNVAQGTLGSA